MLTGSNTCVPPHPTHRARRGRSHRRPAPASRTTRRRACPHPRRQPPHPGHPSRPDDSNTSTPAASLPTVSTGASARLSGPPGGSAKRRPGGPVSSAAAHDVAGHKKGQATQARHTTAQPRCRRPAATRSHGMTANSAGRAAIHVRY
jgi:hypothetical protein